MCCGRASTLANGVVRSSVRTRLRPRLSRLIMMFLSFRPPINDLQMYLTSLKVALWFTESLTSPARPFGRASSRRSTRDDFSTRTPEFVIYKIFATYHRCKYMSKLKIKNEVTIITTVYYHFHAQFYRCTC